MAAFIPGVSPPLVSTPILITDISSTSVCVISIKNYILIILLIYRGAQSGIYAFLYCKSLFIDIYLYGWLIPFFNPYWRSYV